MCDHWSGIEWIDCAYSSQELEEGRRMFRDAVVGPSRVLILLHLATVRETHLEISK